MNKYALNSFPFPYFIYYPDMFLLTVTQYVVVNSDRISAYNSDSEDHPTKLLAL